MKALGVSASPVGLVLAVISISCEYRLLFYLIGMSCCAADVFDGRVQYAETQSQDSITCSGEELLVNVHFSSDVTATDSWRTSLASALFTTICTSMIPPDTLPSVEAGLPFNVTLNTSDVCKVNLPSFHMINWGTGVVVICSIHVSEAIWTVDQTESFTVCDRNSRTDGNISQIQAVCSSTVQKPNYKHWSLVDSQRIATVVGTISADTLTAAMGEFAAEYLPRVLTINTTSCRSLTPTFLYPGEAKNLSGLQRALCTPDSYPARPQAPAGKTIETVWAILKSRPAQIVASVLILALSVAWSLSCWRKYRRSGTFCTGGICAGTGSSIDSVGEPLEARPERHTMSSAFLINDNAAFEPDLIIPSELFSPNLSKSAEVCLRIGGDLEELLHPDLGLLTPEQYRQVVDERRATGDTSAMLLLHRIIKRAGKETLLRRSVRGHRSRFDLSTYGDISSLCSSSASCHSAETLGKFPPSSSPQPRRLLRPLTAFSSRGSVTSLHSSDDVVDVPAHCTPRSDGCPEKADDVIFAERVPITGLEKSCVAAMPHLEDFLELGILSTVQYLYLVDLSLVLETDSSIPWQAMHRIITVLGKQDVFKQGLMSLFTRM